MRCLAVLTLFLLGTLPGVARADRTGEPATAAHATTPDGDGIDLRVQDDSAGGLCLDLAVGGTAFPDGGCLRPPSGPSGDLQPHQVRAGGGLIVYGATSTRTRALRLLVSSGRARTVRTVEAAGYHGAFAGRVRFYVVALAGTPAIGGTVALDAAGDPLAARDLNPMALPALTGRSTVARLRDEANRPAQLLALTTRTLAAQPDRRRRALCVGIKPSGAAAPLPGRSLCVTKASRVDIRFGSDCETGRTVIYGLVPGVVRRVDVFLSGGTARRARLATLPRRLRTTSRAVTLALSSGSPESAVAYGAGGKRLATVGLAPAGSC